MRGLDLRLLLRIPSPAWAEQGQASTGSNGGRWLQNHTGSNPDLQLICCRGTAKHFMPTTPIPDLRHLSFQIPAHQLEHLDRRAAYLGCSRSDYIRRLFVEDLERQQSQPGQA